jgi:hypothetical protein
VLSPYNSSNEEGSDGKVVACESEKEEPSGIEIEEEEKNDCGNIGFDE